MPDDRLGDLGAGHGEADRPPRGEDPSSGDDDRPAAERLRELDDREPEPRSRASGGLADEPAAASPRRGRYMGIVGIVFAALAVWAAFQATRQSPDSDFLRGLPAGTPLPDFAAPLATGSLEGDANVRQGRDDSEAAGARPACEVRTPEVVNVCELRERPLVLTFVVTRGADCAPALSLVDRVSRDYPRLAFAAVVSGDSRERVAELVRARRIRMPVAVDRDGAVVNLYRVGVCPTVTFADRGGTVRATRIGARGERALRRDLDALARGRR